MEMKQTSLPGGVYVAALTPMDAELNPDIELLTSHCRFLFNHGAQGLALMGTTGEANSFSVDERMKLIEELLANDIPAGKIMLGTGCCSYTDTIQLTRHAVSSGIRNILLLPPFYYKQVDDDGLFAYFSRVLEEVAEPELEIYLYHFPRMTGLHFSHSLIERLIDSYPANFIGMKDSGGQVEHMREICRHFPGFKLYAGTEKYLLDVMRMGGAGCISATANVTIGPCVEVYRNWQTGKADALQDELTEMRNIFEGLPFIGILKQYLARVQNNPQWIYMRPPNGPVPEAEVERVLEAMMEKLVSSNR